MSLSASERARRYQGALGILQRNGLDALIVVGREPASGGQLRYLTNFRLHSGPGGLLVLPDGSTALMFSRPMPAYWARKGCWADDVRVNPNCGVEIAGELKARGLERPRIGLVRLDLMPVQWYQALTEALPQSQIVEVDAEYLRMTVVKSAEEIEIVERSVEIADGALADVAQSIEPGQTEYEVMARLECFMRRRGIDQFFNLIGSRALQEYCYHPSMRALERGDTMVIEISPQLEGYWSHLVRMVGIGKPSPQVAAAYDLCRAAKEESLARLRPGEKVADWARAMEDAVIRGGRQMWRSDAGHFIGVDLVEAWANRESDVTFQPGMVITLHPIIHQPDGGLVLGGETYVVTDTGYRRLNRFSDELVVVS